MVYGIGLAGDAVRPASAAGRGRGGFGGGGGRGRGGAAIMPDPGLEKLAVASGGGYFELTATANMKATFARVADELHRPTAFASAIAVVIPTPAT